MTYDQWKCDPGYDDEAEEECWHEDYDSDWEGFATCARCGHMWEMTADEHRHEREASAAFDAYCRREERRERWDNFVGALCFWRRWRKRKPLVLDDECPF